MDTAEYNANLSALVQKCIEDNGAEIDDLKFELHNDGVPASLSIISKWEYPFAKPTKEVLEKLDVADAREKMKFKSMQFPVIPVLTDGQLEASKLKHDGALAYNSSTKKLEICLNGFWTALI
jgi:hypothetical protein